MTFHSEEDRKQDGQCVSWTAKGKIGLHVALPTEHVILRRWNQVEIVDQASESIAARAGKRIGGFWKSPVTAILLGAALALKLVGVDSAIAQVYPSRPITMIIPFAAGGPNDTVGRIVAERMRTSLGQPVLIENVGGGSGNVGVGRAARASPDGYTIIVGNWATFVANGAVYALPYDLLSDFEPVSLLSTEPMLFVSRMAMPANDLTGLIAWLRANPDQASAGTTGPGSIAHVVGVFFQQATATQFQFVPYRSLGLAIQDVVAGRIDLMFDTSANSLSHVQAGSIKAIAVTAKSRLPELPGIPTVNEAGLPELEISSWRALWVPRGTPKQVIDRLNAAIVDTLADTAVRKQFASLGQEVALREQQTPGALGAYHKAEIEKWWPIIKAAGIKSR